MNKLPKIIIIIFMASQNLISQKVEIDQIINQSFTQYHKYYVDQIKTRRFDIDDYHRILDSLVRQDTNLFSSEVIGESFKKRKIKLIRYGKGETKILMWSQMHGDESTASLALLDFINFLIKEKNYSEYLTNKISLYIIPILNPDGTHSFERRNYQEIDINRDALRLQTPEGRILKSIRDSLQPDFAFNLHDQYSNNSVGKTGRPAAIALLAPAFDYEKSINEVRKKSLQLCVEIKETIERFYPGVVARYDDEFEPRAFGDNFQKWGSSTILIESGGYFNDFEKQEIRKMNFIAFVKSVYSIADKNYEQFQAEKFFDIPENERTFFDLLIKNVIVTKDSVDYLVDIGISYTEKFDSLRNRYIKNYNVVDIGDLSTFFAFDTLDAKDLRIEFGKVYEKILTRMDQLKKLNPKSLIQNGITTIIYQGDFSEIQKGSLMDKMISTTKYPLRESKKLIGHSANCILRNLDGKIVYVIINGEVFDIRKFDSNFK